jgi:hypothetical protein
MVQSWLERRRAAKGEKPPAKVDDVLPLGLRIVAWSVPIVLAIVGIVKSVTDMTIAGQQEIRARANAEISFFDRQYQYATDLAKLNPKDHEKTFKILEPSVGAIFNRREPDLYVNWLLDGVLVDDRKRAREQICGARRSAFAGYSTDALPLKQAMNEQYTGIMERPGQPEAISLRSYDERCAIYFLKPPPPEDVPLWTRVKGWTAQLRALPGRMTEALKAAAASALKPDRLIVSARVPPSPRPAGKAPSLPSAPSGGAPVAPLPAAPPWVDGAPIGDADSVPDCDAPPQIADNNPKASLIHNKHGDTGKGWDIDIFWCGKPPPGPAKVAAAEAGNYKVACQAFNTLSATSRVGGESLGRRRLRRLPPNRQDGIYYPNSGLSVRYDVGQASEQLLGQAVGMAVWPKGYALQPSSSGTRWYLSLFACDGAAAK